MGNPALSPLCRHSTDIVVVQVNAFHRPDMPPKSAPAIIDRLNEITFNSSLVLELSMIAATNSEARLHAIADEPFMAGLGHASKFVILKEFLEELRSRGIAAADAWLAANGSALGNRSTLDMQIMEHIIGKHHVRKNALPGRES